MVEFKLGSREIEEGVQHLLQIKQLIKNIMRRKLRSLFVSLICFLVITGGEMAYIREDGVKIIPIGALRD